EPARSDAVRHVRRRAFVVDVARGPADPEAVDPALSRDDTLDGEIVGDVAVDGEMLPGPVRLEEGRGGASGAGRNRGSARGWVVAVLGGGRWGGLRGGELRAVGVGVIGAGLAGLRFAGLRFAGLRFAGSGAEVGGRGRWLRGGEESVVGGAGGQRRRGRLRGAGRAGRHDRREQHHRAAAQRALTARPGAQRALAARPRAQRALTARPRAQRALTARPRAQRALTARPRAERAPVMRRRGARGIHGRACSHAGSVRLKAPPAALEGQASESWPPSPGPSWLPTLG